jgi:hypothetical protein
MKIVSGRIGARHDRPDRQTRPGALRPDQVLHLLSLIAGMAHSTLKSRAATRNRVAFGVSAEDPERPHVAEDPFQSSSDPAADVANYARDPLRMDQWAGFRNDKGRACPTRQNLGSSEPSTIPF